MKNPIIELKINNGKYLFLFYKHEETAKYICRGRSFDTLENTLESIASTIGHEYRGKVFMLFGYVFGFYRDILEDQKNYIVDALKAIDKGLKNNENFPTPVRTAVTQKVVQYDSPDEIYKKLENNVNSLFSKALAEG